MFCLKSAIPKSANSIISPYTRGFSSSRVLSKKFYDVVISPQEASKPIAISSGTEIRIHRIPPNEFPPLCHHGRFSYSELRDHKRDLRRFRESSVFYKQMAEDTAVVEIRGHLGVGYVPVPEWLDLKMTRSSDKVIDVDDRDVVDIWHGQGAGGGMLDYSTRVFESSTLLPANGDEDRFLNISCLDPKHRLQARHWGFYKRRIENYARNVSEKYSLPVKLVGVGYRASIEDMKIEGPSRNDSALFQKFVQSLVNQSERSHMRKYLGEAFPDSVWGQIANLRTLLNHDINKWFSVVYPPIPDREERQIPKPEVPKKLVLKLGFSHDVEMPIPPYIQVSVPSSTTILLSGNHQQPIWDFAQLLRKWRKPEPYKGKGVFVGDEKITLKSKKVK